VPWWMFAIAAGLIALAALPDTLAAARLRQRLRTDAGASDEIRGAIALGLLEAELAAARSSGFMARWSAATAWLRTLRRARKAAKLAGIPANEVAAQALAAVHDRRLGR